MYSTANKQFVFKDSNGKLWDFYYDRNQGICYSVFNRKVSWSAPKVIQADAFEQFYVDIDENDCFHIVYQDKKGNIIYCLMQQSENIKAMPVLTSKTQQLSDKHLSLIVAKNSVYIFFVIEYNNTYMLSYQTINDGFPAAPKKVDNISPLSSPYSVIFDMNDDIYAFYHISNGKNNQIGYKKLSITTKIWSEYSQITAFSTNCESPKVLVDRNSIFHICYHRKYDKQNQLVYQQKIPDRNMWTSESVLVNSSNQINNFSMLSIKNNIIVYYLKDDALFPYISGDLGGHFSRPAKGTSLSKQHICVQYKSNSPYEHVQACEVPASFANGFRLMFTHDTIDPESGLDKDEMKAIILTDLKQLKKEVSALKESQKVLSESVQNLAAMQQNIQLSLQKEISKLLISIQSASKPHSNNTNAQMKSSQARVQNIPNTINSVANTKDELRSLFLNRKKKKVRIRKGFKGKWRLKRRK